MNAPTNSFNKLTEASRRRVFRDAVIMLESVWNKSNIREKQRLIRAVLAVASEDVVIQIKTEGIVT